MSESFRTSFLCFHILEHLRTSPTPVGSSTSSALLPQGHLSQAEIREALSRKRFPIGREAACPSARPMARNEARHGKALEGLLKRYFK